MAEAISGNGVTAHLPLLTTRIRSKSNGNEESPLARQWRLLKLLTFAPKGFTVKELVTLSGMSEKTIRRDLVFLKAVDAWASALPERASWASCDLHGVPHFFPPRLRAARTDMPSLEGLVSLVRAFSRSCSPQTRDLGAMSGFREIDK